MPALTDLAALLAHLHPELAPGRWAFASLPPGRPAPAGALAATVHEAEGVTAVLPEEEARALALPVAFSAERITLTVHSDLAAVGLTAAVATALAARGIACNVIAGLHHDHLFVPAGRGAEALAALSALQRAAAAPWDPALDALVAAPAQHRLLFENDRVRVLDTRIAPGERTPVHTHRWPAAHHVVSWSDFVRRDADGAVLLDTRGAAATRARPEALWGEALGPHSLENVGATPLHVVSTELKTP